MPKDVKAFPVNYWDGLTAEEVAEFSGLKNGLHANLAETSAVLAINPALVDMERANAEFPPFPEYTVNTAAGAHGVLLHLAGIGVLGDEVRHLGRRARRRRRDRRALPPGRRPLDAGGAGQHREDVRGDAAKVGAQASRNRPYALSAEKVMHDRQNLRRSVDDEPGGGAARRAGRFVRRSTHGKRRRIVAATGASQFEFLDALTAAPGIDWTRVEMFHLDEYVGLPIDHPGELPQVPARAADQQDGHHARITCSTANATPRAVAERASDARSAERRSTSRSSASARTATWRSTIRPPTSRPSSPYLIVTLDDGVPAAAGRRRLVCVDRRGAVAGDLDVGAPDPEVARDHLRRARRAKGAGRQGLPRRRRCRRWRRRRSCRRTRTPRSISIAIRRRC